MGNTPASGKHMPCGPESPLGTKRSSMPDGESPNACGAYDGGKECMPLKEQDYLKDAAGKA